MNTYIVENCDEFHKYFNVLKEDARINSVPDRFVIGLDIEFISKANHPESFAKSLFWVNNNKCDQVVCLIQIATQSECMVINITKMQKDIPKNLINLLVSESWIKYGVGVEGDLRIISKNYNLGHCAGGIELSNLASMAKINNPNLERLYNTLIGDHVKKTSSICDWTTDLNREQLMYAARDAIMSYQLGIEILAPSLEHIINTFNESSASSKLELNFINYDDNKIKNNIVNDQIDNHANEVNFVGKLQEYAQKSKVPLPTYTCIEKDNKQYELVCKFLDLHISSKSVGSKKGAKHDAAKEMYTNILKIES
jgi:dsRNA-specific ribonuclease